MPHISLSQITFLLGGFLLLGGSLVLLVYGVHKVFQRRRREESVRPKFAPQGTEGSRFTASLQEVIRRMKAQEKELRKELRIAEQKARLSEAVFRELPCAALVVDADGYIIRSNQRVRPLLGIDIWSRRRYREILGSQTELAGLIQACLETGTSVDRVAIKYSAPDGKVLDLAVSVAPMGSPGGAVEGVACFLFNLTELGSAASSPPN